MNLLVIYYIRDLLFSTAIGLKAERLSVGLPESYEWMRADWSSTCSLFFYVCYCKGGRIEQRFKGEKAFFWIRFMRKNSQNLYSRISVNFYMLTVLFLLRIVFGAFYWNIKIFIYQFIDFSFDLFSILYSIEYLLIYEYFLVYFIFILD